MNGMEPTMWAAGRCMAGMRVLWVATETETRAASEEIASLLPTSKLTCSPGRRRVAHPSGGEVVFVHSATAMRGRVADHVVIAESKQRGSDDWWRGSAEENARLVTITTRAKHQSEHVILLGEQ